MSVKIESRRISIYTIGEKMLQVDSLVNDRYKVVEQIGQGGTCSVWRAIDRNLNRSVAIKAMSKRAAELNKIEENVLLSEARILKGLEHPGLPAIYDFFEEEDTLFLIMTYIEGETLRQILRRDGAQPIELVIDWGRQLCSILGYLHSRKPPIIYRDLKPDNIMLRPDGKLVLIDFGIAVIGESNELSCLGTKGYAAPEQYISGATIDVRTDIYALGMTLYQLATGEQFIKSQNDPEIIGCSSPQQNEVFEQIIEKCTQVDPEQRFQAINELQNTLNRFYRVEKFSFFRHVSKFLKIYKEKLFMNWCGLRENKTDINTSHISEDMDLIIYNVEQLAHIQDDMENTK